MKKAILLIPFILFFLSGSLQAQDDIQIGRPFSSQTTTGALYDFSDPNSINIKVQLWGYVSDPTPPAIVSGNATEGYAFTFFSGAKVR